MSTQMARIAFVMVLATCGLTQAQGLLIAGERGGDAAAGKSPLVIRSYHVDVEITETVAVTKIDQVFVNNTDRRLEGTFYYPLPESAAISEFVMYIGSEAVHGDLVERDEARRIYTDIVRSMRDPAILEYAGRNLFKMDVFPIEPHADKRIQLEYTQQLELMGGAVKYVHPLDAGRVVRQPIESLAINCSISSPQGLKAVYSPSHEVDNFREGDHKATSGFESAGTVPVKDFVLYYTLSDEDFGLSVLANRQKPDDDGYFMMLLAPKQEFAEDEIEEKTVVFAFDTSGSMAGDKVEQARGALTFCLDSLNPGDHFNIVTFSTGVNSFEEGVVPADAENIGRAKEFVSGIKARGGTNIESALKTALASINGATGPTMVVFLTDGLPTVGVVEMDGILASVSGANARDGDALSRIFVFGVGTDVNTHLLDQIAQGSHAASQYVSPGEDIEVAVSSFYEKVAYPVLSDLRLDFGDVHVYDYYPTALPDLFRGSQLTVFGRYRGDAHVAVKLLGSVNDESREFAYDASFPKESDANEFVPRLWATRRVGHLVDEMRLHGESPELRDEVVALGKEWGLVTPYTSYLVLEPSERQRYMTNAPGFTDEALRETDLDAGMMGGGGMGGGMGGAPMTRPTGPAGPAGAPGMAGPAGPAGPKWDTGDRGSSGRRGSAVDADELAAEPADATLFRGTGMAFQTGEEAIGLSQALNRAKLAETEGADGLSTRAADRAFYLVQNVWIDAALDDGMDVVLVEYLSDAYFALLAEDWVAQCLALGERVVVVLPSGIAVQVLTPEDATALTDAGRDDLEILTSFGEGELERLMAPTTAP